MVGVFHGDEEFVGTLEFHTIKLELHVETRGSTGDGPVVAGTVGTGFITQGGFPRVGVCGADGRGGSAGYDGAGCDDQIEKESKLPGTL